MCLLQSRKLTTCATLFSPMNCGPVLRVKQLAVEWIVGAQLRILFGGANLIVDFEDNFRGHPATAQSLILVELRFLRLGAVLPGWSEHAHEVEILLVDPKLWRMQIAGLRPDNVDGSSLPGIFAHDCQIELQSFQ